MKSAITSTVAALSLIGALAGCTTSTNRAANQFFPIAHNEAVGEAHQQGQNQYFPIAHNELGEPHRQAGGDQPTR